MTKILLVEDDKSLREIYGVRLLAEGYDIVSAGDGEEALAMAIKERPALIVSDVMMPKISGFDMLDILRSTTETKDIKVIMMTALSSEDQRQRGEKLGADRYLVKSQVGIEDVVRAVHEVLGDLPTLGAAPQPQASAAPAAATPSPAPSAPTGPAPHAAPTPQPAPVGPAPQPTTLPQPTAPFSSATPRPNSLGDRVLQPIQPQSAGPADLNSLMEQELAASGPVPQAFPGPIASGPAEQPMTRQQPTPQPAPTPPQPHSPTPPQSTPTAPMNTPEPSPLPPVAPPTVSAPERSTEPQPVSRPDVASLSPADQPQQQSGMPTAMPHQAPAQTPSPQAPGPNEAQNNSL